MRSVRFNGDIVTQALSHVAQLEWEWVSGWTTELVKFVLADAEHGPANRAVMAEWLADWLPLADEAALALQPVFDELPAGISFDDARTNVRIDLDEMCEGCGVSDLNPTAATTGGAA
jgi:propane monooxygenase small subunit